MPPKPRDLLRYSGAVSACNRLFGVTRRYLMRVFDTTIITIPSWGVDRFAMPRKNVTNEDEGKRVVDSGGRKIGMVSEVRSGRAYVDVDPGLTDSIRSKLDWGNADQDDYELEENRIRTVTDDEVRLKNSF